MGLPNSTEGAIMVLEWPGGGVGQTLSGKCRIRRRTSMRSFATACLVLVLLVGLASGKEGPRIGPEKKIIHLFQSWPTAKYLKELLCWPG